jgi:hypothetical protein
LGADGKPRLSSFLGLLLLIWHPWQKQAGAALVRFLERLSAL